MSNFQSAIVAREFFAKLRADRELLAAWNALPKDAESICSFVSKVSGTEVGACDLAAMKEAIDDVLSGNAVVHAADERLSRAVGLAYAMVDERLPRAVGYVDATQNQPTYA